MESEPNQPHAPRGHVVFAALSTLVIFVGLLMFLFLSHNSSSTLFSREGSSDIENTPVDPPSSPPAPSPNETLEEKDSPLKLLEPSISLFRPKPAEDYREWEKINKPLPSSFPPRSGEAIIYRGQVFNTPLCSAGFYVTGKKGGMRLVTADHCGYGAFSTEDERFIGETVDVPLPDMDVQFIKVKETVPYVKHFNTELPVAGYRNVEEGDRVCRTGAKTGTVCNLVVRESSGQDVQYTTTGKIYEDLIRLQAWEPTKVATTGGDSGGVVYTVDTNTGEAFIIGIQVAGDGKMLCYGYNADVCYRSTYVLPVEKILREQFHLATIHSDSTLNEN